MFLGETSFAYSFPDCDDDDDDDDESVNFVCMRICIAQYNA